MASMLEGGGKTPMMSPGELESMGFKLCAYPLSLLGVSVRAMEGALQGLKTGSVPAPPAMPSFQASSRLGRAPSGAEVLRCGRLLAARRRVAVATSTACAKAQP